MTENWCSSIKGDLLGKNVSDTKHISHRENGFVRAEGATAPVISQANGPVR